MGQHDYPGGYAEASFDGAHFRHIAAWEDDKRLKRIRKDVQEAADCAPRRVTTPVIDTMDLPGFQYARRYLDSLSAERRAELEKEWEA